MGVIAENVEAAGRVTDNHERLIRHIPLTAVSLYFALQVEEKILAGQRVVMRHRIGVTVRNQGGGVVGKLFNQIGV